MAEPTQHDTAGHSDGNTNVKRRCWAFTWNNYPDEHLKLIDTVLPQPTRYVYQEETGANGTPHLQGAIYFESARSFNSVVKLIHGWHIEPAREHWRVQIKYCTKEDSRTGGQFSNFLSFQVQDPLAGKELYPWQADVWKLIHQPCENDRTIHWLVDEDGNRGKTAFCKHVLLNTIGWLFISAGKGTDILFAVANYIKSGKKLHGVLANYSRDKEGFISYSALESIKDGLIFCGKYESQHAVFDSPHVVCFANWYPEKSKLSADRWDIRCLGEKDCRKEPF